MPLMIPCAPQFSRFETNLQATPSSTRGTSVANPAGAANTKNTTWTEIIASSAFDSDLVIITVSASGSTGVDTSTLIDIGIGAAAAETVVIPDLLAGYASNTTATPTGRHYIFPLRIPAASRISARSQSVRTTGSTRVIIGLFGGPRSPDDWWSGQQVTAYGINLADSGGTSVTAGNSGAEGTATSIGTTSAEHEVLVLGCQTIGTAANQLQYHFDVGIDTASTAWLAQDAFVIHTETTEMIGPAGDIWWPIFRHVPSGAVLVVGGECSGTAQAIDFALYGIS